MPDSEWPTMSALLPDLAFQENSRATVQIANVTESWELADRYSSWPKLIRVSAYVLRFISRIQRRDDIAIQSESPSSLTASEVRASRNFWVKYIQRQLFPLEIRALTQNESVPSRSPLFVLNPFLDEEQIIRVGGRLSQAPIPGQARHPIVLGSHPLVRLLIYHTHSSCRNAIDPCYATARILATKSSKHAPHFGGLWEAGVRSTKHHIRRVVGAHTLTFEEFSTLLCNIEACLNSRPLAPLSDSLDDYTFLTPGHFLIGSALNSIPEPSLLQVKENRLTRWQLVRQMTERLWKVWQQDYINTLQQQVKWRRVNPRALRVGQLVLLRNSLLPPCKWELGRISLCHPGSDGLIRVVTVKTASSEYKRPISKICILPIDIENASKVEGKALL
ncbi:uncharacterized protein LOC105206966 [Solenopsis invicta]|uniref:uncharacterized protein LOC105206966 n=1 Tax=Solenopsis invicta TaxID=13686 RepID=UPI000E33EA7B|nr:uncharacterized protein LOC105206966 [Solenopsis invicta]